MSARQLAFVWDLAPFKSDTLLVLLVLADEAAEDGSGRISRADLQRRSRTDRISLDVAMQHAARRNWITFGETKFGLSYAFKLTPGAWSSAQSVEPVEKGENGGTF